MDSQSVTLPKNDQEWSLWLKLATLNRVETQIFKSLVRRRIQIPPSIFQTLQLRANQVIEQNRKRREEAETLFEDLEKNQIQYILLKGNALSEEIYQDLDYKQMNDFDLLFKSDDLGQLYEIYTDLNYLSAASLTKDFRKQEKHTHHWPPFFSRNMNLFLGTHWNLISPYSKVKIPESLLWKESEYFQFSGRKMKRLSTEMFLIHLCVHLSPYKLGLKELADLYNFIFFFESKINWGKFKSLVVQTHAQDQVFRAFSIVESLFESPRLAEFCTTLSIDVSLEIQEEIKKRTDPPIKALYLRTAQISKIEKNFGFFSLSESPLEKTYFLFKMWRNYLWAPSEECFRLCHEVPSQSWTKRVRVGFQAINQINRAFIQDLGLTVFVLVTLQHHIELAKALAKKMAGRPCKNIAQKADQLGLPLQDLKALSQLE